MLEKNGWAGRGPWLWACLLFQLMAVSALPLQAEKNCSLTSTGKIPLMDLGPGLYLGEQGGLYPGGKNTVPDAHLQAGISQAQSIQPLDSLGNPDPNGKIVFISVGMSNTQQEFLTRGPDSFMRRIQDDPSLNPHLQIVNCAQGGNPVLNWMNPTDPVYDLCYERLADEGVTAQQVQASWVKLAEPAGGLLKCCNQQFPEHAQFQKDRLSEVMRVLKQKFPKLRITHLSSRTRAYDDNPTSLNPEPVAYETNFAVKWMIEDQINGDLGLNFDPAKGRVVAPWLSWGPYLWIDGLNPRSDGLVWECEDTVDGTHPSLSGVKKVAEQLISFYKTSPTATPWFLRQEAVGQPPAVQAQASVISGPAPLTVNFTASASDPDGSGLEYAWSFDDGTGSLLKNPVKTYRVPGNYHVRLTVSDTSGDTRESTLSLNVAENGDGQTASTFYFPVIGYIRSETDLLLTRLFLLNAGLPADFRISFWARKGNPLELAVNELEPSTFLAGQLKQGAILDAQLSAPTPAQDAVLLGYAEVTAPPSISGVALFSRQDVPSNTGLFTAAVPATNLVTKFSLPADTVGSRNTGLALVNLKREGTTQEAAKITLKFFDAEFKLLAETQETLEPGYAVAKFAKGKQEFFPDLGEEVGSIVGESDQPIAVLGLLQDDSGLPFPQQVPRLAPFPVSSQNAETP